MPGGDTDRTSVALRAAARAALESAWVELGYTAPNGDVYPWLWLWDSCFHTIVWATLDEPDRGLRELETALSTIDATGFVPHMGYQLDPQRSVELWGRAGSSSITQPPMFGHAIAELTRAGVVVPGRLVERAGRGLAFLLERRARDESGLVRVVHPWETGCDDSPRWDDLCPGEGFDARRWSSHKMDLLACVIRGRDGEPLDNPDFPIASIGFNALIAWNARELASISGDGRLEAAADVLTDAIEARFDPGLATWIDAGPSSPGSGRARTADALLALLVVSDRTQRNKAVASLIDEQAHRAPFGPRGVHLGDPSYDAGSYWRGPVWPQLAYLLWVATARGGRSEAVAAEVIRTTTIAGAVESGLAEYWDGDRGTAMGAVPQSWTGLAVVLAAAG